MLNDQFLVCRLCSTEYDLVMHLPRLLNECGHTVCEKCIKQQEGHFRCPADETLYQYSIDGFPINTSLFKLIQLREKQKINPIIETPHLTLQENSSISSQQSPCKFLDSTIIQINKSFSETRKQRDELIWKIDSKFNDIINKIELRKLELYSQIDQKYDQSPFCILQIDFQFQMDVLIPRYGMLREELYDEMTTLKNKKDNFLTFSNKDSIDTTRKRSSSRKIFEQLKEIYIPPQLQLQKQTELKKISRALNRSEKIEFLNLKNKQIVDEDLKPLSEALSLTLSEVKLINLSKNQISDQGFITLLDSLWTNKSVKIIRMKNNQITNVSLKYLKEVYEDQKYNSLQSIYLQGNKIDDQSMIAALTKLGVIIYI